VKAKLLCIFGGKSILQHIGYNSVGSAAVATKGNVSCASADVIRTAGPVR